MRWIGRLIPGLGGIIALWLFLPRAIVDRGPYLQVVGHYSQPGNTPLAVGSGPDVDVRLMESGVAPLHGWLIRSPSLRYVHASTSNGSELTRDTAFPKERWSSFVRLQNGDAVRVVDRSGRARTHIIRLIGARTIELSSADGEVRKTLLPDGDGHGVPLADANGSTRSWLIRCNGAPGFSATSNCGRGFHQLSIVGRIGFRLGMPVRPPAGAPLPDWLGKGRIRRGSEIKNAFAQVNGRALQYIPQVNEVIDRDPRAGYVLYRSGRRNPSPRIARTGSYEHRVVVHRGDKDIPVGQADLADGDVLSLGDTYFKLHHAANGQITLRAVEKDDRFHFFYSLSAGRLNFTTHLQPIPRAPAPPLTIEGLGGAGLTAALPPADTIFSRNTSRPVWQLPIAAPFTAAGATRPAHAVRMAISDVRVESDRAGLRAAFVNAPRARWPGDLFPGAASLGDGASTQFAGHILELHARTPRYEQIFPPLAMCAALFVLGWIASGAIVNASAGPTSDSAFRTLLRAFAYVALACISFLIIVGVLMMSRMAALDQLIGKTDYYHRQLVYSYLTVVIVTAIIAGLDARAGESDLAVPSWMGFPLSLPIIVLSGGLLLLWQLMDFVAFYAVAAARIPWGPLAAQLIASAVLLALFTLSGTVVLRLEQSRRKALALLPLACVAVVAAFLWYKGMGLWIVAVGALILWLAVYFISCAPPPLRLSDLPADQQTVSFWRCWRGRLREAWRRVRGGWGVLQARQRLLIALGIVILGSGAIIGSGRDAVGVKPAEFAVWFLAPGLCSMLAIEFRRKESEAPDAAEEKPFAFGPCWPRWLAGALMPVVPYARRAKAWSIRWWHEALILLLAGFMIVLLLLLGRLLSPLLLVGAFAAPIALLTLAWWAHRAPAEDADPEHWVERLRRAIGVYIPVLLAILAIELVVNLFYVIQGDLGPLLVLMPSIGFLTLVWAFSPDYSEMSEEQSEPEEVPASDSSSDGEDVYRSFEIEPAEERPAPRHLPVRMAIAVLFLATCAWGGILAWRLVQSPLAAEVAGPSAMRATKRFLTKSAPWYTKEGSWSTESLWIANHYRDRERMLANLHSDLVFVALVQSFGVTSAIATLVVFGVLITFSFASMGVKMSRWSGAHPNPTVRLQSRRTTLLLYFAGIYLFFELIVHVGSSLNAFWQTGVTMPWISSGGSASVGFGGLCAIALALAVTGLTSAEVASGEREQ